MLFNRVVALFDSNGWEARRVDGREVLQTGFEASHSRVLLHVQTFSDRGAVTVVGESSQTVLPEYRNATAELLTRANLSLTIGGFEMDWDQGKVLFRATNLFPEDVGSGFEKIVTGLVQAAVVETDAMTVFLSTLQRIDDPGSSEVVEILSREDLLPQPDAGLSPPPSAP